ncbi:ATP synthase subunit I [Ramlibacter sp. AW1]|uniref:ATP synthase subunit I n=1 Tax=Ramlibacter aurantiacus TaxID=2801330 RepID=A0A937D8Q3_9BURK|nr:ATP synthase subunit I [Ramlibacter aurantiacus]MBL0423293.1 ATP synthase subunit I [Ramlibacter aurantiacus]
MTRSPAPSENPIEDVEGSADDPPFVPLIAEQARRLREQSPQVSPWWIVGAQLGLGMALALVAWVVTGDRVVGWSALYGAWAVALPAGLYARALRRVGGAGVLAWELIKLGLTVALLAAAPKLLPGVHWLALLAGVVLATKMYWVALVKVRRPRRRTGN